MQEVAEPFQEPLQTAVPGRPVEGSEAPRPETTPSTPETPRFTKKQKLIAALAGGALLAGGAFGLGLAANSGEKPAEAPANTAEPVDPVEEPGAGEEEPTTPEAPATGEFLIPLEQLAEMSPGEITTLTTISVESVTVGGKIDWGLYSQKVVDILELYANAGSSQVELEAYYNDPSVEPTVVADKYEEPIKLGVGLDTLNLEGLQVDHNNQVNTAFVSYLLGADSVYTNMNLVDYSVENQSNGSARIAVTINTTDNFFSSGARNADNPQDIAFGRDEDLNSTIIEYLNVVFLNGEVKLESITTQ